MVIRTLGYCQDERLKQINIILNKDKSTLMTSKNKKIFEVIIIPRAHSKKNNTVICNVCYFDPYFWVEYVRKENSRGKNPKYFRFYMHISTQPRHFTNKFFFYFVFFNSKCLAIISRQCWKQYHNRAQPRPHLSWPFSFRTNYW